MTTREIKVKGEKLRFLDYASEAEVLLTGTVTGSTGDAGTFKVKGSYLHWIDIDGNDRRALGTLTGSLRAAGEVIIYGEQIYYGDIDGNERYVSAIRGYIITTGAGSPQYSPARIVRALDGTLWCAYFTSVGSISRSIYVRYSTDEGVTWSDAELAASNTYYAALDMSFDLVVLSNGEPHLIWEQITAGTSSKTLYHTWRNSLTNAWDIAHEDITGDTAYRLNPRVAIDSHDDIHCVYNENTLGSACVMYVKRTSGMWGTPLNLATKSSREYDQSIAIDGNDYIHVAYCGQVGDNDICYRVYTTSWQTEEKVVTTVGYGGDFQDQVMPVIAIDSSNNPHVAWAGDLTTRYKIGGDTYGQVYGVNWFAVTFTPVIAYTLYSLAFYMSRTGNPGTMTVSLRLTDGDGKPTGGDLFTETIDADTFGTSVLWRTITLTTPYALTKGVKYAIVVRCIGGVLLNRVNWRMDTNSSYSAGGNGDESVDSGGTWDTPHPTSQFYFITKAVEWTYCQICYSKKTTSWSDPAMLTEATQPQGDPYGLAMGINALGEVDIIWLGTAGQHIKYSGGSWGSIENLWDDLDTVHTMVFHLYPSGLLASGYMVVVDVGIYLRFYEGV